MMQDTKVGDKVILESHYHFLPMEDKDWSKLANIPLNTPLTVRSVEDTRGKKMGGIWIRLEGFEFWHPLPKFKKA
jgi:hypothetical protein